MHHLELEQVWAFCVLGGLLPCCLGEMGRAIVGTVQGCPNVHHAEVALVGQLEFWQGLGRYLGVTAGTH